MAAAGEMAATGVAAEAGVAAKGVAAETGAAAEAVRPAGRPGYSSSSRVAP